ncbi:hypothetical protein GJ496_003416 [Pomphorhynchus laevis]|nr:hypothetical protein GJ496_003416 [Pomphorhynchus laevis]
MQSTSDSEGEIVLLKTDKPSSIKDSRRNNKHNNDTQRYGRWEGDDYLYEAGSVLEELRRQKEVANVIDEAKQYIENFKGTLGHYRQSNCRLSKSLLIYKEQLYSVQRKLNAFKELSAKQLKEEKRCIVEERLKLELTKSELDKCKCDLSKCRTEYTMLNDKFAHISMQLLQLKEEYNSRTSKDDAKNEDLKLLLNDVNDDLLKTEKLLEAQLLINKNQGIRINCLQDEINLLKSKMAENVTDAGNENQKRNMDNCQAISPDREKLNRATNTANSKTNADLKICDYQFDNSYVASSSNVLRNERQSTDLYLWIYNIQIYDNEAFTDYQCSFNYDNISFFVILSNKSINRASKPIFGLRIPKKHTSLNNSTIIIKVNIGQEHFADGHILLDKNVSKLLKANIYKQDTVIGVIFYVLKCTFEPIKTELGNILDDEIIEVSNRDKNDKFANSEDQQSEIIVQSIAKDNYNNDENFGLDSSKDKRFEYNRNDKSDDNVVHSSTIEEESSSEIDIYRSRVLDGSVSDENDSSSTIHDETNVNDCKASQLDDNMNQNQSFKIQKLNRNKNASARTSMHYDKEIKTPSNCVHILLTLHKLKLKKTVLDDSKWLNAISIVGEIGCLHFELRCPKLSQCTNFSRNNTWDIDTSKVMKDDLEFLEQVANLPRIIFNIVGSTKLEQASGSSKCTNIGICWISPSNAIMTKKRLKTRKQKIKVFQSNNKDLVIGQISYGILIKGGSKFPKSSN